MTTMLSAGALRNLAEYEFSSYHVQVPPGTEYADIFRPVFWAHHPRLKRFDCIRVVAHDWSWDVTVTVIAKTTGGAHVQLTPLLPPDPGEIEKHVVERMRNGKTRIRVEYQKATNWRVIALDGSEHSRGHETRAMAVAAMKDYVHSLGMVMPDDWETDIVPREQAAASAEAGAEA